MNVDRSDSSRDKFVLSKGHGVPILYSVFSELGWIKKDELNSLRQIDSRLQGHPDKIALECLDSGSGALGQGISISIGYALAQQMQNNVETRIVLLVTVKCKKVKYGNPFFLQE